MNTRRPPLLSARPVALAAAVFASLVAAPTRATDIDIYGATGSSSTAPNILFFIDNTSNWSSTGPSKTESRAGCISGGTAASRCDQIVNGIYGSATSLKQGQLELRALRFVLNELACNTTKTPLNVNVGLSVFTKNSVLSTNDGPAHIRFAVQQLTGKSTDTSGTSSCAKLAGPAGILMKIDAAITADKGGASSFGYGPPMYEMFKYFGGHTKPGSDTAGTHSPTGYGPQRFSAPDSDDDPAAFSDADEKFYKSPITEDSLCGKNHIVFIGNTLPNDDSIGGLKPLPSSLRTSSALKYTPPSGVEKFSASIGEEWAYFLANTDVSPVIGKQSVITHTVDVYDPVSKKGGTKTVQQHVLLKAMAQQGGGEYLDVGNDISKLIDGITDLVVNIAGNSGVFSAVTLPVSTTTQGTFLNQIFVGMFRPDTGAGPRWIGNLKQYQLGFKGGVLELQDSLGKTATSGGFFANTARSFWTHESDYFANKMMGKPESADDAPDGEIVDKGGAAQMLRESVLLNASKRNMFTSKTADGTFEAFNAAYGGLSEDLVKWVRGEANVATDSKGAELFVGSHEVGGEVKSLGSTGARHSVHGDVLHARPVALNYGGKQTVDGKEVPLNDVVVFYGTNHGVFHAVSGRQTDTDAGKELWSFVPSETRGILSRLRAGEKEIYLPENNADGSVATAPDGRAPKDWGVDGPVGVYARYGKDGSQLRVGEAALFITLRRGGQSVYAIDVSDKVSPKFMWRVNTASDGYADLGQTWSQPKPVLFSSTSDKPPVTLLMGGGYDPAEDAGKATVQTSGKRLGSGVYIINGRTGAVVHRFDTDYSVPSDVSVVDVNGDGEPDRGYVADVRGNLYRIDFPTDCAGGFNPLDKACWDKGSITKIAVLTLSTADGLLKNKVFYPPDVVVTKQFVAVLLGTGDREKPLVNKSDDRFFLIKDHVGAPRGTAINIDDLTEVAEMGDDGIPDKEGKTNVVIKSTNSKAAANPEGCYISLSTDGEKVVNAPFTIQGVTYFGTNRPKPKSAIESKSCTPDLGQAYNHSMPLFCGVPTKVTPVEGGGLLPSPVGGIVTINGVPTAVLIGTGTSPFVPEEPKPVIKAKRTRLNWRIDNKNR